MAYVNQGATAPPQYAPVDPVSRPAYPIITQPAPFVNNNNNNNQNVIANQAPPPVVVVQAAAPQTQTEVVRYGPNQCNCCGGAIGKNYTTCGILWCICCFPIGILCCLSLQKKKCQSCGKEF